MCGYEIATSEYPIDFNKENGTSCDMTSSVIVGESNVNEKICTIAVVCRDFAVALYKKLAKFQISESQTSCTEYNILFVRHLYRLKHERHKRVHIKARKYFIFAST